jgi:hypothetical protein
MSKTATRKERASATTKKRLTGKSRRAATRAASSFKPVKLAARKVVAEKKRTDGSGPLEWLLPMMESAYTSLNVQGATPRSVTTATVSSLDSSAMAAIAPTQATVWRDVFREYKQRKAAAIAPPAALAAGAPPAPFVPGARNWLPLGPSVVLDGQTVGDQPVAGRVSRLAVAPGGAVVYAASANGGVFRSADGGTTWRSMMDSFDLDPTNFATASLVCGAVALDPTDPSMLGLGKATRYNYSARA